MMLLAELRAQGLCLEPREGGRVHVTPRERITATLRARIVNRKPELLAALDLARRIRVMGARWDYTADDLTWALDAAERDPAAWLIGCAADEAQANTAARASMKYPL
jgi:hypothetical protein